MKILYKYITKNLVKTSFGLILLFSVIIVSSQFMHLPSVVYFMSFFQFLKLVMFINFSFFKYQLLFAFFLSSVLVGYKIRESREIYAIFASGISIKQLLKPIWGFSIFLSILALFFSIFVVPYSNRERANFITVNVKKYFLESVHPKNFSKISGNAVIYAEEKQNKKIKNLFIYMQKNGWTITAQEARFEGTNLILNNGFIQIPQREGFNILMFKTYIFNIDVKYMKKYSFEDFENKTLLQIIKKKKKNMYKALAILTDRFSFFIPFIFIGSIGFLLGVNTFSSREGVVSTAILIAIGYLLINFIFIKIVSTGKLPFYISPLAILVYFYSIYFILKKKSS